MKTSISLNLSFFLTSVAVTATPEQKKTGRSFSQFGRKSIGYSQFMSEGGSGPVGGKSYSVVAIQEEATRIFKNSKSEHIKNYSVQGTRGESIGLLLVEMASMCHQGNISFLFLWSQIFNFETN